MAMFHAQIYPVHSLLEIDLIAYFEGGTGPQDRFENMFMTSLELEAHKKKLTGAELEIRVTELEHIKCEQDKEIEDLTKERNTLEKELLESKHRIDDLEEINKDQGNSSFLKLEQELRDAKCFIEELKENKDTASLQQQAWVNKRCIFVDRANQPSLLS